MPALNTESQIEPGSKRERKREKGRKNGRNRVVVTIKVICVWIKRGKVNAEKLVRNGAAAYGAETIEEGLNAEEAPICQFQQSNMIDTADNTGSDIFFSFKKHLMELKQPLSAELPVSTLSGPSPMAVDFSEIFFLIFWFRGTMRDFLAPFLTFFKFFFVCVSCSLLFFFAPLMKLKCD